MLSRDHSACSGALPRLTPAALPLRTARTPRSMQLAPHPTIPKPDGPVMVCILDGWGVNVEDQYNAVFSADTPCTDALRTVQGRYRAVKAHGTAVGLPSDADMGNSEVGHNALGSGQVVDQGARLVDLALSSGQMFEGAGWKCISGAFADHTVHFIGLLSDGGVHSRYDQLIGCIRCGDGEGGGVGVRCAGQAACARMRHRTRGARLRKMPLASSWRRMWLGPRM